MPLDPDELPLDPSIAKRRYPMPQHGPKGNPHRGLIAPQAKKKAKPKGLFARLRALLGGPEEAGAAEAGERPAKRPAAKKEREGGLGKVDVKTTAKRIKSKRKEQLEQIEELLREP